MGKLVELAERCEAATGADMRIALEIAGAFGWRYAPNKGPTQDVRPVSWVAPDGSCHDDYPDFTASLDAALTLMPEGLSLSLLVSHRGKSQASLRGAGRLSGYHAANTPALALCAASLRARAEQVPA